MRQMFNTGSRLTVAGSWAAAVLLFLFSIFCMNGCGPKEEPQKPAIPLIRLKASQYPVFRDDHDFEALETAINNSLRYYKRVPLTREFVYGEERFTAEHLIRSFETFSAFVQKRPSQMDLNRFIRENYLVYRAAGNEETQTLFTGYYEPVYPGSMEKSEHYPYPVFSIPNDLVRINLSLFSDQYKGHKRLVGRINSSNEMVPYFSRKEINRINDFDARSQPLVWLENRVDRFFLEIQGSGRVQLENGEQLRIHYALSNGKAYSSIGRYLINKNEIPKEKMSMQAIRVWLEENPDRMDEVLHVNDSFVFFQLEKGGPYGSLGVEVTAMRSIATDSKLFPKGALCFIDSFLPDAAAYDKDPTPAEPEQWPEFKGFMMNQDTG
ncbi:MAG: murein transglycosylase, partial [Desulfobacteraceae bacterium]